MNVGIQTQIMQNQFLSSPSDAASGKCLFDHTIIVLQQWRERAKQRRHLATLEPRELSDVGISSKAAIMEAAKPFWRA